MTRQVFYLALAGILAAGLVAPATAQETIKIGELNSYKSQPAFLDPYKKGLEMAVEEINAKGGVLGKKLEVVTRDDGANPGEAVRVAEELVTREGVAAIAGTFLSNIGLAVTNFAGQKKVFFLAAEPLTDKITWQNGNKYTYRLRASTYMQTAMLLPSAVAAKKKKWALVYPNFEYGQAAAEAFKTLMKKSQPDVEFVTNRPRRWARSMPARWRRRSTMPSPTRSSMCCSGPTSPSSCARAILAACSRIARWSACYQASRNISIR
jgi:branched-chain amino acid transport system substrate-binding protein